VVKTYVDTSVLFSLYAQDANSTRADAWRKNNSDPLPFSIFHRLELRNALSLAVFQKRLSSGDIIAIWANIEADIRAGSLNSRGGLWHRVFSEAEALSATYSPTIGCRTLDVIHVAAAKIFGSTEFCSFDPRQSSLASQIGLAVAAV
jgi:uncharacterized protein